MLTLNLFDLLSIEECRSNYYVLDFINFYLPTYLCVKFRGSETTVSLLILLSSECLNAASLFELMLGVYGFFPMSPNSNPSSLIYSNISSALLSICFRLFYLIPDDELFFKPSILAYESWS